MKKYTRGFTLIELLVVIAIIGILASVVLVSLNTARKKGSDTRVIADVQQLRTLMEADYNGSVYPDFYITTGGNTGWANGTTTNTSGSANVATIAADAIANGGFVAIGGQSNAGVNSGTGDATHGNFSSYVIFGKLISSSNYFCISSNGSTAQATSTAAINSPNFNCQ